MTFAAMENGGKAMSNIEHLIENALTAMEKNPKDTYQAFVEAMSDMRNQYMLKEVSISKNELWAIAQYIFYTWLPNVGYKDLVPQGEWIDCRGGDATCSRCGIRQKAVYDDDNEQCFCGHCGARMKGGESDDN